MTCQHFIEAIGTTESGYGGRREKVKKCRYNLARSKEVRSVPLPWKRGQRVLEHSKGRMGRICSSGARALVTGPAPPWGV